MSELDELQGRFASLETACRDLSGDVHALTETLIVVVDLQREQREQALRQERTEKEIATAKEVAAARYARTRAATRWITVGLSVLIPLASVVVYASLLVYVNELLDTQNKDRYANCTTRNLATEANITREELLGRIEKTEGLRRAHADSAAALKRSQLDCSQYLDEK